MWVWDTLSRLILHIINKGWSQWASLHFSIGRTLVQFFNHGGLGGILHDGLDTLLHSAL